MPRIVVQAVNAEGEARRWTISERIVAANFQSDHYTSQLIERLAWATADAETLETQAAAESHARMTRSGVSEPPPGAWPVDALAAQAASA